MLVQIFIPIKYYLFEQSVQKRPIKAASISPDSPEMRESRFNPLNRFQFKQAYRYLSQETRIVFVFLFKLIQVLDIRDHLRVFRLYFLLYYIHLILYLLGIHLFALLLLSILFFLHFNFFHLFGFFTSFLDLWFLNLFRFRHPNNIFYKQENFTQMHFNLFKKKSKGDQDEKERTKRKLERIKAAKPSEQHRAPNPCQCVFPEENFIDFTVLQENKPIKLQTYRWKPEKEPRAIVFMFHGLCAHMNHGAHIAKELANIGCIVVGFDHRGFGKSEGIRGFLESIPIHLQDSREWCHRILSYYGNQNIKDLPIFLTGLSMGGMTSFRLSIDYQKEIPVRGVVMFAPAIKPIQSSLEINAAKTLGKFKLMPKMRLIKPGGGKCTKNPQVSKDLHDDPYTYKEEMLPGTAKSILQGQIEGEKMYPFLTTPWLLVQGGLDKLVDPDVAHDLYHQSQAQDKDVLYYEDCWHDIWHEQEILDALPKVIKWIDERIQK